MREVKRSTSTPICAGENLYLRWGFRDLIEKQAADPPLIEDGHIRLPDGPGLGVELNEEAARSYARPGRPFFE